AHEHSYSRTYLLSSCRDQTVASTASTLILSRDDPSTPADEGRSFVFVSGLGGKSIRSQLLDGPWWASVDTSTQGANYGALFGVFDYQGDPAVAHFYFKEIGGRVVDDFFVRSAAAGGPRPCTTAVCDCPEATPCDDGDACTVDDACDAGGVCRAGAPRSCEDFDACTVDTCSPRSGCDHRPIVLADVRRVLTRGSRVEACAGQRLPKSVARRLGRARRLLGRASRTGNGAGRAITRALHLLGQAEAALGSAQQHLSPGCAAALRGQLDDASTKMSCLRPGSRAWWDGHSNFGAVHGGLALRDRDAREAFLADVQDPASPRYAQFITQEEFDALYGPTEAAEAAVVAHLERSGLRITDRAPNRLIVGARGSVAAIERAFGVAIHDVSFRGARHYAALEEPTFPADIADAVVGVIGLDDLVERQPRVRASGPVPAPHAALGSNCCHLSPNDLATFYDNTTAYTGTGQTIVIAGAYAWMDSDNTTFNAQWGLPALPAGSGQVCTGSG